MMKKAISFLLILMLLLPLSAATADDSFNVNKDGYSTSYTYGYDYWQDVQESPDAYRVSTVIDSVTLGLDKRLSKPQSLYVRNKDLYIVDTLNNRIVQVENDNGEFRLKRTIEKMAGGSPDTFNNPYDVFVDAEENIYIADCNNNRIIRIEIGRAHV